MDSATELEGRAAALVDEARLWRRHMEMAKLGATPKGGVRRPALTSDDNRARALLAEWGAAIGFTSAIDPIGNFFVRREGSEATALPVVSGSHTDTQPSGGKFDGIYGVLAALEAMEAIERAGIKTRRPIEAAVWTSEEGGSRFQLGCLGSSVFAGATPLADALAAKDYDGVSVATAIEETRRAVPMAADRALGFPLSAFVEAHIEQGPELEAVGKTIGIVTVIQGARRFLIEVTGEDGHAGTVKRALRKDAFLAAIRMAAALERHFHDPEDVVRFTIGRFVVTPNAPAVIPGRVIFTVDFRHPEPSVLDRLGDGVARICEAAKGPCGVKVEQTSATKPVHFSGLVPDLVEAAARRLKLPAMRMLSGAGHDSIYLNRCCPTGMIFVPCEKGISHSEIENAAPSDLAAGARVLAEVLVELANRPD
ncbi:MAG: hydantoinase/carbamoylase family amidase [Proteobacteria bacterium]|nr:hydantoinase/carbamoylase family amidase [Pseudomonadota bacterium]MBI3498290.1 hydantoinase/carbamoylase family amidase [Pseudomonadota bacterium]